RSSHERTVEVMMLVTVGSAVLLALLVKKLHDSRQRQRGALRALPAPQAEPAAPAEESLQQAFGLALGDVVLLRSGDEAWLSSALVFEEGAQTMALFCGPDVGGARYVL